jgi:hypothetical protein
VIFDTDSKRYHPYHAAQMHISEGIDESEKNGRPDGHIDELSDGFFL